ncbi:MAG: 4-hydroxythreonine-4-phosphate dehydrogenase PdxA [Pseudomonadota bacterium]
MPNLTLKPIVLSMGEPAGIGPDLISMLSRTEAAAKLPSIIVTGDHAVISARSNELTGSSDSFVKCASATEALEVVGQPSKLPILEASCCVSKVIAGQPDPANAPVVIGAIDLGLQMIRDGQASALVTNPIQKETLYAADFAFPGHTEYLAEQATRIFEQSCRPVMMIHTPDLRTIPITIHIPLREVPTTLTTTLIIETCRVAARDLADRFGIGKPRLAVAGLNPHAGEGGTIGTEDQDIIAPAVSQLLTEGVDIRGPLPADTMFHAVARRRYDVAICMYHDQALIPAKALGFDVGVNATLGLPFIRTSPDHGTGLDIAGTGKARPDSLFAAIRLASDMASRSQHSFHNA